MAHRAAGRWVEELAAEIVAARESVLPIDPPSGRISGFSVDDGHAVQRHQVELALAGGRRRVGRSVRRSRGAPGLESGVLLDDMVLESGSVLACDDFIAPHVATGLALVLQRGLRGPAVTTDEVGEAIGFAVAALQITDSRLSGAEVGMADAVADNAGAAVVLVNDVPSVLAARELASDEITLTCDGEVVASGDGAAMTGDPLELLCGLVHTLSAYDDELRAGELVLLGSVHAPLPVERGRRYRAVYRSGLSVELTTASS